LQQLRGWNSTSSIEELIGVLLALYAQHNKARIAAAATDERILFELAMLDELGCTEVLLTGTGCEGCLHKRTPSMMLRSDPERTVDNMSLERDAGFS
jgi:hypothetical protein